MNLLELVEAQLTDEVLGSLGAALGESREATRRVLTRGAVPAIVAGLGSVYHGEAGAVRLLELLRAGGHDGTLLQRLVLAGGGGAQTDALVAQGRGLLGQLLHGHEDAVIALLATASGMRRASTATLLSLSVPIVLAVLGRPPRPDGATLAAALRSARARIDDLAEPGLASAMGLTSLAADPANTQRKPAIWSWLVVPAITLGVFFVLRSCQQSSMRNGEPLPEAAHPPAHASATAAKASRLERATPAAIAASPTPAVAPASVPTPATPPATPPAATAPIDVAALTRDMTPESTAVEIANFLADPQQPAPHRFVLRGLGFDSSTANLGAASLPLLGEVARVLAAWPLVSAEIQGHTDSSGGAESNRVLSERRAQAVLEKLVTLGVARERLSAAGLGATQPLGPNDTIEGRVMNRRIELLIKGR
jgi:outer membrane protein OmpA-like peptidoglycan-associated protein